MTGAEAAVADDAGGRQGAGHVPPVGARSRDPRRALTRVLGLLRSRWARAGFVGLVVALGGYAVWRERVDFLAAAGGMGPGPLTLATVATAGYLASATLAWRAVLADYGHRLPVRAATRVFLVGQLGKFLPGSVWAVVAHGELGADLGVPRSRSASASVVALALSVATGALLGLAALAVLPGLGSLSWLLAVAPVLLAVLYPPVLERLLGLGLRLLGRSTPTPRLGTRGLLVALWWTVLAWLLQSVQVAVLAVAAGARLDATLVAVAVLGFPLAWLVGFLVVVSPAGVGPREAALVLVMAPVLSAGEALAVALVSRVVLTAVDLGGAGAAVLASRRAAGPSRHRPT